MAEELPYELLHCFFMLCNVHANSWHYPQIRLSTPVPLGVLLGVSTNFVLMVKNPPTVDLLTCGLVVPPEGTLGVYRSKIGPLLDLWREAGVSCQQAF